MTKGNLTLSHFVCGGLATQIPEVLKIKHVPKKQKICNMDIEGGFFMVSTIYLYLPRRMKHINNTVKRIALVDLSCIFKKVNSTQTNAFYQFISKETFY